MTDSGLFFPPPEVIEPATGTAGMLMAGMERLNDPLLVNPPFCTQDQA